MYVERSRIFERSRCTLKEFLEIKLSSWASTTWEVVLYIKKKDFLFRKISLKNNKIIYTVNLLFYNYWNKFLLTLIDLSNLTCEFPFFHVPKHINKQLAILVVFHLVDEPISSRYVNILNLVLIYSRHEVLTKNWNHCCPGSSSPKTVILEIFSLINMYIDKPSENNISLLKFHILYRNNHIKY